MSLLTPIGLLAFPNLFVPKPPAQGADPRYSTILLLDEEAQQSPEYKALRQAVLEAIAEEWGAAKAKDAAFVNTLRLPFRKAEEKAYEGFEKGHIFIAPWTKQKPGVVDKDVVDIIDPQRVFAGQKARIDVNVFAYNQSGNKGVSFGMNHIQITDEDMPRFDGRKSAAQSFTPVAGSGGSAASMDDDLPF